MTINDSKRLSFALMNRDDADLLFQLDQDPDVLRYINGGIVSSMQDIMDIWVPRMEHYTNAEQGWGLWKVTVKANEQFIGWVLVRPMDYYTDQPQWSNIELGWRFMQNSWGKGYGTEAAMALKAAIAANENVTRISAIAVEENSASINIMKKLGMAFDKKELIETPRGGLEVVFYHIDV